ncbi:MAG: holo-ACP synthase [Gammaproteobacteria bacterium]|nr:holo-ACP synthase [Gammaproteobacteria bacterium]
MIYGIGTDIVRVARMQKNLERFGDKFAARILTDEELAKFRGYSKKANYLAKRFAAKEAAAKALGLGFQNGLQLKQISINHDKLGKPIFEFSGFARQYMMDKKITSVHLSLSDEDDNAVAFVVMETNQ